MSRTPFKAYRLDDDTVTFLEAIRSVRPRAFRTYAELFQEIVRFYLAHQRTITDDVRRWLAANGYPKLADADFSRPGKYDLPPEFRSTDWQESPPRPRRPPPPPE